MPQEYPSSAGASYHLSSSDFGSPTPRKSIEDLEVSSFQLPDDHPLDGEIKMIYVFLMPPLL